MKRKKRQKRTLQQDLNVTNLVDVTFAILVVFMITAPLMSRGIQVDLPKTSAHPLEDKEILRVSIDEAQSIFVEKTEVSFDELNAKVKSLWDGQSPVAVNSDSLVPYGKVLLVVNSLQEMGVKKIGFLTQLKAGE